MTSEIEKIRTELLTGNALTVVSKFNPDTEFPLTNLDWNATSRPLKSVETMVEEMAWKRYGNPNSCGTLTSQTSGDLIEECSSSILGNLGLDNGNYQALYGGDGSTHWLQTLARKYAGRECVVVQEELHTSLIQPFVEQGCRVYRSKTTSWIDKFTATGGGPLVVLVTLMSHLTGDEFDHAGLTALKNKHPGILVVVDATSYLAHRKRVPEDLLFDYLVFSGHKFPGGPSSVGCMVCKVEHHKGFHTLGTPNVIGICRLAAATRVRTRLMTREDPKADEWIALLENFFITAREANTRFVLHAWNSGMLLLNRKAPVFCFSVELTDRNLLVHPQVVAAVLLNAFGIQIRAGGHCSDTVIARGGVWDDLRDLDLSTDPVLYPSVCRISFPRYLITEAWVKNIIAKLTDFLRCVRFFLRCFTPSRDGWKINDEFVTLTKKLRNQPRGPVETVEPGRGGCAGCAKNASMYKPQPPEKTDKGPAEGCMLYSKISGSVVTNLTLGGRGFEHPFRWFALPEESKLVEGDLD
jgi:selenocysteine lyase/cysteine desulfurase